CHPGASGQVPRCIRLGWRSWSGVPPRQRSPGAPGWGTGRPSVAEIALL
ncbi:MAG: hypothetical protein AVDCRST_MAG25-2127, partial [uncultured Rubrobacteraceae bacterium]